MTYLTLSRAGHPIVPVFSGFADRDDVGGLSSLRRDTRLDLPQRLALVLLGDDVAVLEKVAFVMKQGKAHKNAP